MTAMQREEPVHQRKPKISKSRSPYTSDSKMNELLTNFVMDVQEENIWISIDASDLEMNRMGNELYELVSIALDTARENCIETTPPRGRYIKFRSREIQQQLLIQIQFSCEDRTIRKFDKRIVRMRDIIESSNGYLKLQLIDEMGSIRIALPEREK